MGVSKKKHENLKPFTEECILNKELVIKMLKYEDEFAYTDKGQEIYKTELLFPHNTLGAIYAIHRCVLDNFGFDTSDTSVENYRKIFSYYYNSPTDYDNEVLSSVFYMRSNKCVYYTKPKPTINDKLIDVNLLTLNGDNITLYDILKQYDYKYAFVGAFSNS